MKEFILVVLRICGAVIFIIFLLLGFSPEFSLAINPDAIFSREFYLGGVTVLIGQILGLLLWGYSNNEIKKIRNE